MTIEQIIARHKQRSGFRLADYAEVAIPVYKLQVQALTLAHRRLPPVEEFILKCLALNVQPSGKSGIFSAWRKKSLSLR